MKSIMIPIGTVLALAVISSSSQASSTKQRPLREIVQDSDLILVGTVSAIDAEAGIKNENDPMTRIDVLVDRTLRGAPMKRGEIFSFFHRGGKLADGTYGSWSSVEPFAVGDTYVLFLASGYVITPVIGNAWRVVEAGAGRAIVDQNGRTVAISATHGVLRGSRVADSLLERSAHADTDLILVKRGNPVKRVAGMKENIGTVDTPLADAEAVLANLAAMSRASMPVVKQMRSGERPLPLNLTSAAKETTK